MSEMANHATASTWPTELWQSQLEYLADAHFYFLAAGDRYNLKKREVIPSQTEARRGFERMGEQAWEENSKQ